MRVDELVGVESGTCSVEGEEQETDWPIGGDGCVVGTRCAEALGGVAWWGASFAQVVRLELGGWVFKAEIGVVNNGEFGSGVWRVDEHAPEGVDAFVKDVSFWVDEGRSVRFKKR